MVDDDDGANEGQTDEDDEADEEQLEDDEEEEEDNDYEDNYFDNGEDDGGDDAGGGDDGQYTLVGVAGCRGCDARREADPVYGAGAQMGERSISRGWGRRLGMYVCDTLSFLAFLLWRFVHQ